MLGVKVKKIKTKNSYTLESLYEAIKDKTFTAGQPSLTKHGIGTLITFPALDSQNQVQVIGGSMGKEFNSIMIQKGEEAGMKNMVANAAIDKLTGGIFGFNRMVGKNAKTCEELVETTAKELEALGL